MELVSGHAPARRTRSSSTSASAGKGHFAVGETVHVVDPGRLAAVPARRRRDVWRRRQRSRRPGGGVHARTQLPTCSGRPVATTPSRWSPRRASRSSRSRPTCARRCTNPPSRSSPARRRRTKPRGDRLVVAVREHVPDDVRVRGARRRFVRDLQHLLDHRGTAHQGDGAAAGHRCEAPSGAAVGRVRGSVHRRVRFGGRRRGRHRPRAGSAVGAVGVRSRPAGRRHRDRASARSSSRCSPASSSRVARRMAAGPPGRQGRTDRGAAGHRSRQRRRTRSAGSCSES